MKRGLAAAVMTCSLVLSVAAATLWVRSYFVGDVLYLYIARPRLGSVVNWNFGSERGGIFYYYEADRFPAAADRPDEVQWGREPVEASSYPRAVSTLGEPQFDVGGFKYLYRHRADPPPADGSVRKTRIEVDLVVPHPAIVLLIAIPAALRTGRWRRDARRRYRLRHGLCPRCGYDLRAGTGERCPECGGAVPPPPGVAAVTTGTAS